MSALPVFACDVFVLSFCLSRSFVLCSLPLALTQTPLAEHVCHGAELVFLLSRHIQLVASACAILVALVRERQYLAPFITCAFHNTLQVFV